jgi:hypothetical protein
MSVDLNALNPTLKTTESALHTSESALHNAEALACDTTTKEMRRYRATMIGICNGCHGAKVCAPCFAVHYCDFALTRAPDSVNFDEQKAIFPRKDRPVYFCKRTQGVDSQCYNKELGMTLPCTVCYRMDDADPEGSWVFNPEHVDEMTKVLHTCPCCTAWARDNHFCRVCGYDCFVEERRPKPKETMKRKERS